MDKETQALKTIKHIVASGSMRDSAKITSIKAILSVYEESFKNG